MDTLEHTLDDEMKVERTITIEVLERGGFNVREGDKLCDRLGWDEMLGHVATMTLPEGPRFRAGQGIYPMLTKTERDHQDALRAERIKKLNEQTNES